MLKVRGVPTTQKHHKALVLCDEDGTPLPGQRSLKIDQRLNDVAIVTVEFVIGRHVVIDVPGDEGAA